MWRHPTCTSRGAVPKTRPPAWHMGLKERARTSVGSHQEVNFGCFRGRTLQRESDPRTERPSRVGVCRQRWDCYGRDSSTRQRSRGIAETLREVSDSGTCSPVRRAQMLRATQVLNPAEQGQLWAAPYAGKQWDPSVHLSLKVELKDSLETLGRHCPFRCSFLFSSTLQSRVFLSSALEFCLTSCSPST